MAPNLDGVVYAFLMTFGPRAARIYTHGDHYIAGSFLTRGLDVELRLTDADAAMRAERHYSGRAAVWDPERDTDPPDRVAVLYNPFDHQVDVTANLIAWLCRQRLNDVLLVSSTSQPRDLADLEVSIAESGYEFHPRAARLASATGEMFPIVRAYQHRAGAGHIAVRSALALCTEGANAALTRADLAAQFVRPGDLVFDEGGWGGGSAIVIHTGSAARRTIGFVSDARARDSLDARYGQVGSIDFMIAKSSARDSESPDFIFYTAELIVHHADHLNLIITAARSRLAMLTPAGRLFIVIEFARSANRADLVGQLIESVKLNASVERLFYQNAATASNNPDELFEARSDSKCEGDWLILVVMTSPLAEQAPAFVEHAFAIPVDERFEVARFGAAYLRPWIIKGLVARGMRPENAEVLRQLAAAVQRASPRESVDYAAALCVEAYQIDAEDTDGVDALRGRIADWLNSLDDPSPHWLRWQVSLLAVLSQLHLSRGDVDAALEACLRCAKLDVVPFSPLLGSKTLEAMHLAAVIRLARGECEAARAHLRDAVGEAKRLLSGDWLNILGDIERPLLFGMPEASQVLAVATRSAVLLTRFEEIEQRGGAVWSLMSDLSGQVHIPKSRPMSSSAEQSSIITDSASNITIQTRLVATEHRLADVSAELSVARGEATTAYALAAAAKDQVADAFAQLAELRRDAAARLETAQRETADARGQATTAYAVAAAAKDQAVDAFAQLAEVRRDAAAKIEVAHREMADTRRQATAAYAVAATAKDQTADAFAQLADVRRDGAATVEAANHEVVDARGQATAAYAVAAAAKDQAADAFAQLAEVRRDAAAKIEVAYREMADARGQATTAYAMAAAAKDQAADAFAQLAEVRRNAAAKIEAAPREEVEALAQAATDLEAARAEVVRGEIGSRDERLRGTHPTKTAL